MGIVTNFTEDYVLWRYLDIPVTSYTVVSELENNKLRGFIIGRLKQTWIGRKFRITDVFYDHNDCLGMLKQQLEKKIKEWSIDYSTIVATDSLLTKNLFGKLSAQAQVGPKVTVRRLRRSDLTDFENFSAWCPSLGDLEIF